MVRPISPTTPARVVTLLFSFEIKKTMYAEVASCGTCRVIEMITQRTAPPMRISVRTLRSCDGANSRRSHGRESTVENRQNRRELGKGRPSIPVWVELLILCYL